MLATRGVYFHIIDTPHARPHADGDIEWVFGKPEWRFLWGRFTCYVDGSAFHNNVHELTRCGFSIVVVDDDGSLVAVANGVPPEYVDSSAAAELWAVLEVYRIFGEGGGEIPLVVTDCDGVREGVQAGPGYGTGPRDAMARTWRQVWRTLGGAGRAREAAGKIAWMPSHTTWEGAQGTMKSDGGRSPKLIGEVTGWPMLRQRRRWGRTGWTTGRNIGSRRPRPWCAKPWRSWGR